MATTTRVRKQGSGRLSAEAPVALVYGGVVGDEQEVTIRLDHATRQAFICSTWAPWSRKLERRYGPPGKTVTREGKITSAVWTIPVTLVSLRRPRAGGTPAQGQARKAAGTRLASGRKGLRHGS